MEVRFVKSAILPVDFPPHCSSLGTPLREVAVIGRSNVGKSSLLNTLFGRKGMVFTSATPGKTRLLNFFCADERLFFVDFPGFGFAKVGKEERLSFISILENYFEAKRDLALVLYLFDLRRDPTEEDLLIWDWFKKENIPVVLVATKVDKFGVTKRTPEINKLKKAFKLSEGEMVPFSSLAGIGKSELWRVIDHAVHR